jgi:CRISPR-associated protein Csb1
MRNISIDDINAAILNGGAGSLLVRVELEPASGLDGIIAPAKYAGANSATYV